MITSLRPEFGGWPSERRTAPTSPDSSCRRGRPRAVPPAGTWLTPFGEVRALVSATATAWVAPSFGHAESGATAPLVARIGRSASGTIDP
jgi:hypothetical protein